MSANIHVYDFAPQTPVTPGQSGLSPGAIIFLVHGGASSSRMYDEVVPLLTSHNYHVKLPDLPGHGKTAISARTRSGQIPQHHGQFQFSFATTSLRDIILELKQSHSSNLVVLVGISLGGQIVLDFLSKYPYLVSAAIVSGVSIHPPDGKASWEMPRLPTEDERWMKVLTEDMNAMGVENAQQVQDTSFNFTFDAPCGSEKAKFPPTLVLIGENDVAMAKRDFKELATKVKAANSKSEEMVLQGAWHNHSIDVPEVFADIVIKWIEKVIP